MTMKQTTRVQRFAAPALGVALAAGLVAGCSSSGGTGGGGSGDSGGNGNLAAFCKELKGGGFSKLTNAGSDPQAGVDELSKLADLAPSAVRADADSVQSALQDALSSNKAPSNLTQIEGKLKNILLYAQKKCPGGITGG